MNFTPKTEDQLARERLLSAGEYPFSIMEAVEKVSKNSGNEMVMIKLRVFADDWSERHVYDYLLEAMGEKLLNFCKAVGLEEEYMTGSLRAEMCEGREGFVKLEIEAASKGYKAKNTVVEYVPRSAAKESSKASEAERLKKPTPGLTQDESDSDVIPF